MSRSSSRLLTIMGWVLIAYGILSGISQALAAFGPSSEILGGPFFAFQYVVSVLGGVLVTVVPGVTLLLVIRTMAAVEALQQSTSIAETEQS